MLIVLYCYKSATKIIMLFALSVVGVFLLTHQVICDEIVNGGIAYATQSTASLWPLPASVTISKDFQAVDAMLFHFRAMAHSCDILEAAFIRYVDIIFRGKPGKWKWNTNLGKLKRHPSEALLFKPNVSDAGLTSLDVSVENECEKWPSLEMDETCELLVFN